MNDNERELVRKYMPELYFDRNEPFYPDRIGVSIIRESGASPSFSRELVYDPQRMDCILEFAIYWDYDIQHLYDLEHIWVYVGKDGQVLDCEGSFHGNYLKGLLSDRSNLSGTHVKLYAQPGKHAFSPRPDLFELLPDLRSCTDEQAGTGGLLVTQLFKGVIHHDDAIDQRVNAHLRTFRFQPAMMFERCEVAEDLIVAWPALQTEIPLRIQRVLDRL